MSSSLYEYLGNFMKITLLNYSVNAKIFGHHLMKNQNIYFIKYSFTKICAVYETITRIKIGQGQKSRNTLYKEI